MRILLISIFTLFISCSDPIVQECKLVEMPLVSEKVPNEQIQLPTKTVLLLDYSGSMHAIYPKKRRREPYFFKKAAFAQMLADWLDYSTPSDHGNQFEIVLFNDQPFNFNPINKAISKFSGLTYPLDLGSANSSQIAKWLRSIPPNPYKTRAKPIGRNGGLTQIKAALESVVDSTEDDAIIWLLTDNVADQAADGTSAEEANSNKAFYDYLKSEFSIKAVLGYPLKNASLFKKRSLMLYGLYHSKSNSNSQQIRYLMGELNPEEAPKGLLWNPALETKTKAYSCDPETNKGKAIRLKPIDTEVLSISLGSKSTRSSAIRCDPSIKMDAAKAKCTATVTVTNNLSHQTVTKAEISLTQQKLQPKVQGLNPSWIGDICADTLEIEAVDKKYIKDSTIIIQELQPNESRILKIRFSMENPPIATSSLSEIIAVSQTPRVNFAGELYVTVDGIETRLDIDKSDLSCIAKSEEVPDLFKSQTQSKPSTIKESFAFKLKNSGTEQAMLLLIIFGAIGFIIVFILIRFQGVGLELVIDGKLHEDSPFKLVRVSRKEFGLRKGDTPFVRISRGWGKSYKVNGINGYIVELSDDDLESYVGHPIGDDSDTHRVVIQRAFSSSDSLDSSNNDF